MMTSPTRRRAPSWWRGVGASAEEFLACDAGAVGCLVLDVRLTRHERLRAPGSAHRRWTGPSDRLSPPPPGSPGRPREGAAVPPSAAGGMTRGRPPGLPDTPFGNRLAGLPETSGRKRGLAGRVAADSCSSPVLSRRLAHRARRWRHAGRVARGGPGRPTRAASEVSRLASRDEARDCPHAATSVGGRGG
jgi:hypothetical protein